MAGEVPLEGRKLAYFTYHAYCSFAYNLHFDQSQSTAQSTTKTPTEPNFKEELASAITEREKSAIAYDFVNAVSNRKWNAGHKAASEGCLEVS